MGFMLIRCNIFNINFRLVINMGFNEVLEVLALRFSGGLIRGIVPINLEVIHLVYMERLF